MPEGGQFFINLRRWGPSRMAVLFTTESAEEGPVIVTFSTTEHGEIGGSNSGTYIPELANDRWYDYTLIDTGEELFVFIDDQFTLALPISDELPDAGQLGLEWHRPCIFDSLSVATVDGVTVPIAVQEIR